MPSTLLIIFALVVFCVLCVTLPAAVDTFRALSGPRLVTCPANGRVTEVSLDARLGALTCTFGPPWLRVSNCAYWPYRSGCDQGCIAAIDAMDAQRHGLLARPLTKRGSDRQHRV